MHAAVTARRRGQVFEEPHVQVVTAPSASATAAAQLAAARAAVAGPLFAILDADHGKDNVTLELQALAGGLREGDYIIVEDSNLDGHPVYPGWGPSPFDAVTEFLALNRRAFRRDVAREAKFGWTQAAPAPRPRPAPAIGHPHPRPRPPATRQHPNLPVPALRPSNAGHIAPATLRPPFQPLSAHRHPALLRASHPARRGQMRGWGCARGCAGAGGVPGADGVGRPVGLPAQPQSLRRHVAAAPRAAAALLWRALGCCGWQPAHERHGAAAYVPSAARLHRPVRTVDAPGSAGGLGHGQKRQHDPGWPALGCGPNQPVRTARNGGNAISLMSYDIKNCPQSGLFPFPDRIFTCRFKNS
jgi:hypothetical protein